MQGAPKNTIILHWDEYRSEWAELPWRDWLRFRGLAARETLLRALPGLAGAQHSAACWQFLSAIGICRPGTRAN
jgi:hypothetical protein